MSTRQHPLMRAAATLGDLGNPFYTEERQREVWNEASAVGFQFFLWAGFLLAAAMAWFGGPELLPWTGLLVLLVGGGSWVTVLYANALGVKGTEGTRLVRPRMAVYGLLTLVLLAGVVYQASDGQLSASPPTILGAVIGAGLAAVALTISGRLSHRSDDERD